MKVVITNEVALNAGDAAILSGTCKILAAALEKRLDITVLDQHGKAPGRYYPEYKFQQMYRLSYGRGTSENTGGGAIRRGLSILGRLGLSESLRIILDEWTLRSPKRLVKQSDIAAQNFLAFQEADLIVCAGGTYLVEHYNFSDKLAQLAMALDAGPPVIMFTQSLGPFKKPMSQRILRHLLPRLELILLRDKRSQQYLMEAGISIENTYVVSDAAFALADPEFLDRAKHRSFRVRPKVAISVRHWTFPTSIDPKTSQIRYKAFFVDLVVHLVRQWGAQVTFLSTCQGTPEYEYDDSHVARSITKNIPEDVIAFVQVNTEFHSPDKIIALASDFDFAIATRMHMSILALIGGIPVIPIVYEFKTEELFNSFAGSSYLIEVDNLNFADEKQKIDDFIKSILYIQPNIMEWVNEQHHNAMLSADLIRNAVSSIE